MPSISDTMELQEALVPADDGEHTQRSGPNHCTKNSQQKSGVASDKSKYLRFLKADQGIQLSDVMLYSVTPETVANKISDRVKTLWPSIKSFGGVETVIDLCGGAGGNTIAFSRAGFKTVYVDIDIKNLQDAVHNSHVYNQYGIDFLCADAVQVDLRELSSDPTSTLVFFSPEWGGPNYKLAEIFDTDLCNPSVRDSILRFRQQGFFKIAAYLPRNVNLDQLAYLGAFKVEYLRLNKNVLAAIAWFDERNAGTEPFVESLESELK